MKKSDMEHISRQNTTQHYIRSGFQQCVVKQKPRLSLWPITKDKDNPVNQSKLEANTRSRAKRGKTCKRIRIGLGFSFDWSRSSAGFLIQSQSVVKQHQSNSRLFSALENYSILSDAIYLIFKTQNKWLTFHRGFEGTCNALQDICRETRSNKRTDTYSVSTWTLKSRQALRPLVTLK